MIADYKTGRSVSEMLLKITLRAIDRGLDSFWGDRFSIGFMIGDFLEDDRYIVTVIDAIVSPRSVACPD